MKDFLNSPLLIFVFIGLWIGIVYYRKFRGLDKKCGNCGSGKMEEFSAKPESILDSSNDRSGLTLVRYNVTYKCTNCGETLTRTESRK